MARRGTRGLAAAAALVLALGLVACGGDDDGGEDAADETTTEATDETTTEAGEPSDDTSEPAEDEPADETTEPETTTTVAGGLSEDEAAAIPDQVDLDLIDVQSFNPTFEPQELDDEDEALIDGCIGDAAELEPIAEGDGAQYEASAAYAASGTSVMASEEDAIAVVDALSSDEAVGCLADGAEAIGGDVDLTADFTGYPDGTRFADQWANVGGLLTAANGVSAAFEVHMLRTGPIVTFLLYLDRESGESTAYVVDGLLTLIDERQAAAVG